MITVQYGLPNFWALYVEDYNVINAIFLLMAILVTGGIVDDLVYLILEIVCQGL